MLFPAVHPFSPPPRSLTHLKASHIVFDFVIFCLAGGKLGVSEADEGTSDRSLSSRASLEVIEVWEVEEAAGDNWNSEMIVSKSDFLRPSLVLSCAGIVTWPPPFQSGVCRFMRDETSAWWCVIMGRDPEKGRDRGRPSGGICLLACLMHLRKHGVCSFLCASPTW